MASQRVGMNIKRVREAKGWSQERLAQKAKLHRVSLAKIEAQMLTPTLPTLDRIAKALGLTVTELVMNPVERMKRTLAMALIPLTEGRTVSGVLELADDLQKLGRPYHHLAN